ncbi:hypothetical protein [Devosia psychrophila]|uniref:hypothetical protein n=1 Tax=Devosia psychrophila TaxID=728005 RepID=UPI000AA76B18|nr:hypothetical protein [Devosia psychrophila]
MIISSDLDELFGTCDRILVMAHGEIAGELAAPQFDRATVLRLAQTKQRMSA